MPDTIDIRPAVHMLCNALNGLDAQMGVHALHFLLAELTRQQYEGSANHAALDIIERTLSHFRRFPEPVLGVAITDTPATPSEVN